SEVEEEGRHYVRIEDIKKNIWCNATPARQAARGSNNIGAIGCVRHCLPRRYRLREAPAFLGDGRRKAPDSPRDGACSTALSLRIVRREALPSQHNGTRDAALDATLVGGDTAKVSNVHKLDLPLQLGKGTLNPK
ncbi:hypothetical protein HAX54_007968, partial [Datura stramonium]|nr:hypothetical protein [Datura stramonium]